jgi:outer membrane protein OmpA-like peptidoglycan-associated protein/sugar phosphate permease
MFMDISSEMIHALLPVYLVTVLGTSTIAVGIIEGIAEATANITKIFSGALSDWLGKRKLLTTIGYGLAAFTKPIFPLATTVGVVVAARFIDRIGKGIRDAPRDALVADLAPADLRGASFGLRQSLDTVGAFVGPLAAIAFMALSSDNFRFVFWMAVMPAFISLAVMVFAVREPARHEAAAKSRLRLADTSRLSGRFWAVVGVATILTLARFSEAFLILRSQNVGLPLALVPMVMVVMNVVYALSAYPAGVLSDRLGRGGLLTVGIVCLIVADLILALGPTIALVMVGVVFWGLHMALTQGLFASLVADTAPADLRGTAFGVFNFAGGIAMLVASVLAGGLWDAYGPTATFLAGAGFTAVALIGLMFVRDRAHSRNGAAWTTAAAVLAISLGSILIAYAPKLLTPRETGRNRAENTEPPPTQQIAPAPPAAPTLSKETNSAVVKEAPPTNREREISATTTAGAPGEFFKKKLPNGVELNIPSSGIEANLLVFLEQKAKPTERVTWFDFDRLQFETGKTTPQASSREQLQNIADILTAYPSAKVLIGDYTDKVGNPGASKRLSKARAASVRRELMRMGVDASRLNAKGYGDSHPLATNDTEDGRSKNRRISLGVIRK